jgi:HSP20 family protein
MTNLITRDSLFQDLFDFRRDFDQIFSRMLGGGWPINESRPSASSGAFTPAVESFVDKKSRMYHLRVALPGIDPKEVQIHAQGNMLVIRGERKWQRSEKDVEVHYEELSYGAFERTLTLPEGVESDKLAAEYHNGVLELTAPVAAAALPRRIEVKAAPMAKQIAA